MPGEEFRLLRFLLFFLFLFVLFQVICSKPSQLYGFGYPGREGDGLVGMTGRVFGRKVIGAW
jgi:hypothetical protein